jgi:hypothetical protein
MRKRRLPSPRATQIAHQILQMERSKDIKETVRKFLARDGVDNRGRSLDSILSWPDDELEAQHDFIQWLFPLDHASQFNPDAPVLTRNDFAELGRDSKVRAGLRNGFARMLNFYGLERQNMEVVKSINWDARSKNWAWVPTHNDLRVTRILRSMTLFGLHAEATAFARFLETMLRELPLTAQSRAAYAYWRQALVR